MLRLFSTLLSTLLLTSLPVAAEAADADNAKIDEWKVPWENSRPRDPFAQSEDAVWFVGQRGNYLAVLNPQDGNFKKFDLPAKALPHNLIVDKAGIVWYAGNGDAHIGRLDPATGKIERIDMPDKGARDPHTLVFDNDENIWFTVQGGNRIGHLDTKSRQVRLVEVSEEGSRPYGIKLDSQGRPWVVEFGTNKLAMVDPESMKVTEIEIPRQEARPRRLVITPDDVVWYGDYAKGILGAYDPKAQTFTEWPLPGGAKSQPYGMEVDDQGKVWVVEFGLNPARFVRFDPVRKEFDQITEIESGGGVRHTHFFGPTRTVWFGTDTNTIGKVQVPVATSRLTN
jgi:virginiamycin B lyase